MLHLGTLLCGDLPCARVHVALGHVGELLELGVILLQADGPTSPLRPLALRTELLHGSRRANDAEAGEGRVEHVGPVVPPSIAPHEDQGEEGHERRQFRDHGREEGGPWLLAVAVHEVVDPVAH